MYHMLWERRPVHVRDSGAIEVTVESPVCVYLVSYITCIKKNGQWLILLALYSLLQFFLYIHILLYIR